MSHNIQNGCNWLGYQRNNRDGPASTPLGLWENRTTQWMLLLQSWGFIGRLFVGVLHPCNSTVISGWALTCDSAHPDFRVLLHWEIRSSAPWPNIPLLHYSDTELTSPCFILLMLSTRLGSDKYQFYKSLVSIDWEPHSLQHRWPTLYWCGHCIR